MKKLDRRIQPFLHPDFFFVNIGANDGVMNDPIFPFIERYGWRGIAVEPVPHVFEQLSANYAHLPDVILERVAISEVKKPFWFVQPGSGSMEYAVQQIGSLKPDYVFDSLERLRFAPNEGPGYADAPPALRHESDTDAPLVSSDVQHFVETIEVECISFNALMDRHGVDHIDYLNIDTEGCDWEVLRSVDLDRFRPELLCIEVTALADDEAEQLAELVDEQGYVYLQHLGIHSHVYASRGVLDRAR